ncbi:MAG: A/G-specific adenine glycosylase [Dehalococcoidia bacterium]|nr:A/G-specific adenine glycosylase [Dehalococcoidia bacterium]
MSASKHTITPIPVTKKTPAIESLQDAVYAHFEAHGRDFPWRHTSDPYHILVSEVMLQQTQTARVAPKYTEFITVFPDVATLAHAPVADVLRVWQGLGYNRRALALRRAAQQIVALHDGRVPENRNELLALPGIGTYSASAIRAFAFNLPDPFIETNIRAAFIHHFFPDRNDVTDRELMPLVEAAMDGNNPCRWYQALMDYGAALKESDNAARRSAHHRPQSRFAGSRREARGIILRLLLTHGPLSLQELKTHITEWDGRFEEALGTLQKDDLLNGDSEGFFPPADVSSRSLPPHVTG